ncbi:MAG: hypothetical protein LKM44_01970 [Wolbachia endosymbiont of Meromenopon meropis]|nr:hypothetical protein [Wolbachia endosymbiont of Meromenopon meropis]
MPKNDEKGENTLSIRTWKNTVPMTKMGIEVTVAAASLVTAVATILIASNLIIGPEFLASIANPVGIVILFGASLYFILAAYSSYQQIIHENKEMSRTDVTNKVEEAVRNAEIPEKVAHAISDLKGDLVSNDQFVPTFLNQLMQGRNLVDVKTALGI